MKHHISDSEWRRAVSTAERQQRREFRLFALALAVGAGIFADLVARGADSLFGRAFIWLATGF